MPVTSRPSFISRTIPRKSTAAPFALRLTRLRSAATSIGCSTIAEYTSSPRNGGNERDLVARSELAVARRVLLVHGDHRSGRKSFGASQFTHVLHDVLHRGPGLEIELDGGATDGIGVGGEEQDSDGHLATFDPTGERGDGKALEMKSPAQVRRAQVEDGQITARSLLRSRPRGRPLPHRRPSRATPWTA